MFKTIISILFRISVLGFLLGGLAVVALQASGLITGNGDLVKAVTDHLAPWVYGSAGVAGLLAFAMSYFPHDDLVTPEGDASPRLAQVPEHA